MATAGDLNKADGDILYAADVTALLNVQGSMFKDTAQNIFNSAYIGWDSELRIVGTPEFKNLEYTITPGSDIDTASSTGVIESDNNVIFAKLLDAFGTGTVDTDIWTDTLTGTGAVTEDSGELKITSGGATYPTTSAIATADQTNATDYKAVATDNEIYFTHDYVAYASSSSGTGNAEIGITDGTTFKAIWSSTRTTFGTNSGTNDVKIKIDYSAETAIGIINGSAGSSQDISALSNWYLYFKCNSAASSGTYYGTIDVHFVNHILNSANSDTLQTSAKTANSTVTNAVLVTNFSLGNGISSDPNTYYMAADGTNFEEVTPNEIHNFTNTGTSLKIKVVSPETTSGDISAGILATGLGEYAIKYNLY